MAQMMSKGNRMDAVEAAFAAKGWPADFRLSTVFYAARRFCGYEGASYIAAVDALAERYTTADEIAELPSKAARARS
jgi:hypothetical protein